MIKEVKEKVIFLLTEGRDIEIRDVYYYAHKDGQNYKCVFTKHFVVLINENGIDHVILYEEGAMAIDFLCWRANGFQNARNFHTSEELLTYLTMTDKFEL